MDDERKAAVREKMSWAWLQVASDDALLQQLRGGNDDALAVIVDRYQRQAYRVAHRIVKDPNEAESIVKFVFLDLFRKRRQFDASKNRLKIWLLQSAYIHSINRRYQLQWGKSFLNDEVNPQSFTRFQDVDSSLSEPEIARIVSEALACLKPEQRRAVELISIEGLTIEEAAETLGATPRAVIRNYTRGMLKLRAILVAPAKTEQPASDASENHTPHST